MSVQHPPEPVEYVAYVRGREVIPARTLWAMTVEDSSSYFYWTLLPSRPCHQCHIGAANDDDPIVRRLDSEVTIIDRMKYDRLLNVIAEKYANGYWGRLYHIATQLRRRGECYHDVGAYAGILPLPVRDDAKRFAPKALCDGDDYVERFLPPIDVEFNIACERPCPSPNECWVNAIHGGIRYRPPPLDDWTEEEIFDLRRRFLPNPFDDTPTLVELRKLEETLKKKAESSIAEGEAALKEHESSPAFQLECDCPFPIEPSDAPEHTDSDSVDADNAMDVDSAEIPAPADASSPTLAEAISLETQLTQEAQDTEYAEDELVLHELSIAFEEIWGLDGDQDGPVSPITPLPSLWLDNNTPGSRRGSAAPSSSDSEESFRSCEVAAETDNSPDRAQATLANGRPTPFATPTDDDAAYWRQRLLDERAEKDRALEHARELVRGAEARLKRALEIIDDASTQPSKRFRL